MIRGIYIQRGKLQVRRLYTPVYPKLVRREREGEDVSPADSERWISEIYSIINSVENRQGAEKLSIHRSRALG